ncbi:hypothetical protein [Stappia sp.]|uniref:hypothetical protein n=1 Tax=Stappia sp. TaxID=1870903 RepID=UPI003C7C4C38
MKIHIFRNTLLTIALLTATGLTSTRSDDNPPKSNTDAPFKFSLPEFDDFKAQKDYVFWSFQRGNESYFIVRKDDPSCEKSDCDILIYCSRMDLFRPLEGSLCNQTKRYVLILSTRASDKDIYTTDRKSCIIKVKKICIGEEN